MARIFLQLCLFVCLLGFACGVGAQALAQRSTAASQTAIDTPPESFHSAGPVVPNSSVMVPRLIKFSGAMKDGKGDAKSGTVGVTFAIYAEQEGGAPLWMETQNVQMDEGGHYTVLLGASRSEGVPLDLFSTGQARWLGVEAQDIEEVPRVLLVSVPFALKAADAETLGGQPLSSFVLNTAQATGSSGSSATTKTTAATSTGPTTAKTASSPTPLAVSGSGSANVVPKWLDSAGTFGNSSIFDNGTNVAIGTISPTAALHVNGNTLLVKSGTTAQTQVSGAASSWRIGQDANGTFMASDTSGSSLRFLTNSGSLNEWMRIGSTGSVNIGSAQAAKYGEAVFAQNNLDTCTPSSWRPERKIISACREQPRTIGALFTSSSRHTPTARRLNTLVSLSSGTRTSLCTRTPRFRAGAPGSGLATRLIPEGCS